MAETGPFTSMESFMQRIVQLSVACLVAGAASACSTPDQIVATEDIPTAGVRFIHAVPDTMAMDFRFVDIVESNAHYNIAFRNNPVTTAGITSSTQVEYKNTRAGQRHFRIFLSGTTAAIASTVIKDTTVTIEAGKNYTAMLWGNARGGATPMRLVFMTDAPPDPGAQVALRVVNTGVAAVDVRHYPATGTAPAAATWAAVAPFTSSAYANSAPGQIRINAQPAGGGTALFADALALLGAAPAVDLEGLPGTTVAGSALSAFIFPRSVVGSAAPQTAAFTTPSVSWNWDRRPPRLPGS